MSNFVIVDFEWTSWAGNFSSFYGKDLRLEKRKDWQKREIIQIGAIKFNSKYKIISKLNLFVKPTINPKLSNYIKKLTGISQRKIDTKGKDFKNSFKKLKKFCTKCKVLANGEDEKILIANFKYNKMKNIKFKINNIKPILKNKYKIPNKFSQSGIIHVYFGYKKIKNKMHDAVYDCGCIIKAMKKLKFNLNYIK